MADVFRVHDGTTNGSPIASTSYSTLDDNEGVVNSGGAGPSLAQLLQETVRESARRGSRSAGSSSSHGTLKGRNDASLNNKLDNHAPLPSLPSLSSPSSRAYISSLLSKDLAALLKEPEELSRQSDLLDGDLATLCFKSIGDLLGVGDCVDSVEDGFGRMQDALDSLLSCTEQLSSSCTDFTSSINPILSSRARLNLVRNNVASIEDILSIPRLVSTCIRGGWWNEAVDLAFRARELEDILKSPSSATTHNKDTGKSRRSLLGKVREDVEDELEALRSRIIEGLRGRGLKLPSAVRSIALLRRLSSAAQTVTKVTEGLEESKSLSEPELRLTFLASRWDCLRSQLDQLEMSASSAASSDDRLRSIKRWIEIWREVVGETVNIYNEIFLTSLPSPPARTSPLPLSSKEMPATPQSDTTHSPLALSEASPPLALFLTQAQNALRSLLQTQLPHLSAVTSLVSLQTQLSYCAAAFSKFGFDFRHIPHRAIASRLLQITCERFDIAVETFRKDLSRALTQSGARSGKPRLVISALVAAESCDSIAALEESDLSNLTSNKTSHAAAFIALFPPLAKLLNNYATALNELRLLPITSLYPTVVRTLRVSLNEATANMVQFVKIALESQKAYPEDDDQAEAEEQTMILRKSSLILSRCILPWVSWALDEVVYPDIRKERWKDKDKTLDEAIAQLHESLGIQTKVDEPQEESTSVSNGAAKPETSKAEGADEPNDSRHENGVINDVSKEAKPVQAEGRPVEGDVQEKTTPDKDIEDALDEQ